MEEEEEDAGGVGRVAEESEEGVSVEDVAESLVVVGSFEGGAGVVEIESLVVLGGASEVVEGGLEVVVESVVAGGEE